MATLGGQRGTFTWALGQYNKSDDPEQKTKWAKTMAKALSNAQVLGVTIDAIAQNKDYPDEVNQYIGEPTTNLEPDLTEEEALKNINESVDTSNVMESGQGIESVYAYGYACCPDRLKIGATKNDVIQRIVSQINTSTPDKPILYLKIKTPKCMALERAIHATLEIRERKIQGGGTEWFKTTCEEILSIRKFITQVQ